MILKIVWSTHSQKYVIISFVFFNLFGDKLLSAMIAKDLLCLLSGVEILNIIITIDK